MYFYLFFFCCFYEWNIGVRECFNQAQESQQRTEKKKTTKRMKRKTAAKQAAANNNNANKRIKIKLTDIYHDSVTSYTVDLISLGNQDKSNYNLN